MRAMADTTDPPADRRRSWWGWGWADEAIAADTVEALAPLVAERLGRPVEPRHPPRIGEVDLPTPRIVAPEPLAHLCSTEPEDRAGHAYGKSFRDVVRAFHGDVAEPPDLVARPTDEADLVALLDWCGEAGVAAVPYGAGSSVVGGVETGGAWAREHAGVVSLDMGRLDRVLEVDPASCAARIAAGATGPVLEGQLRPHGLTLRHFPQSFEFSTLGGWIATRSGGHYATNRTHIDDFVESVRMVTPQGILESRRLPGSGAGPSPDRLVLGSEGILGVVTEAWMRVAERPVHKATASVRFPSMADGAAACRVLARSGLWPANCRLLDPGEAAANAGGSGEAVLVLGFESAHHPVGAEMALALEACADAGGDTSGGARVTGPAAPASGGHHDGVGPAAAGDGDRGPDAAEAWRSAFLAAPYLRDAMVSLGCIAETFETAVTWDRFEELHASVTRAAERALAEVCAGGTLTCRFTHVYPDGAAPYFTVLAPSAHGDQLAMWDEVKAAVSEAILASGGTITHHHAVGRDHRPWYDRQRPDLFADALVAAKATLDPAGILNPGVLVDPRRAASPTS
jgi:alkyldihydroxyacetonephosphate synthase